MPSVALLAASRIVARNSGDLGSPYINFYDFIGTCEVMLTQNAPYP